MSAMLGEEEAGHATGAQRVSQRVQEGGRRGNHQGSHGWLYEALQIIVRILAFTLRKIGTLECFRQRNDRI